jgi:hypothetical protein
MIPARDGVNPEIIARALGANSAKNLKKSAFFCAFLRFSLVSDIFWQTAKNGLLCIEMACFSYTPAKIISSFF